MYTLIENNSDFLIALKPPGVGIHTEQGRLGFIAELKEQLQLENLLPVHRLDKVTSGLVLCARHHDAASELSLQFQQRKVEKYYLAVSDKKPRKKQGAIVGDMARSRRSSWKLCSSTENPAVTQFFSYSVGEGKRLFLLKPKTGKTHQLRVALKSIGSPIIGDKLYGQGNQECTEGILLHAYCLGFSYQGQDYRYSLLPEHWPESLVTAMLECNIQQPWQLKWPTL